MSNFIEQEIQRMNERQAPKSEIDSLPITQRLNYLKDIKFVVGTLVEVTLAEIDALEHEFGAASSGRELLMNAALHSYLEFLESSALRLGDVAHNLSESELNSRLRSAIQLLRYSAEANGRTLPQSPTEVLALWHELAEKFKLIHENSGAESHDMLLAGFFKVGKE